jgi:hypothetical protein
MHKTIQRGWRESIGDVCDNELVEIRLCASIVLYILRRSR